MHLFHWRLVNRFYAWFQHLSAISVFLSMFYGLFCLSIREDIRLLPLMGSRHAGADTIFRCCAHTSAERSKTRDVDQTSSRKNTRTGRSLSTRSTELYEIKRL